MAKKPMERGENVKVFYEKSRWKVLKELRGKAIQIMEALDRVYLRTIVYGSLARGDVSEKSDIDIFLPDQPSSFLVETTLERLGIQVHRRKVVQATPFYAVKGYIELDEQHCLSFPLVKLRQVEREFYTFSGEADLLILKEDRRVLGINKHLMLIEPCLEGHTETTIVGREGAIARLLGISVHIVRERVRALLRRNEVGRTGVFIAKELAPNETFELILKKLSDQNPAVRRRIQFSEK